MTKSVPLIGLLGLTLFQGSLHLVPLAAPSHGRGHDKATGYKQERYEASDLGWSCAFINLLCIVYPSTLVHWSLILLPASGQIPLDSGKCATSFCIGPHPKSAAPQLW